ncbi:MAG: hypothetical protein K0R09_1910 [Clostridiales bacterium]|nr:hypothetical protein [Clostridiales bacterium]
MENNFLEKYAIEQMRLQRHDFMNYLQVIYGYIQIKKPNEAIGYIKNINKHMITISKIYNLECDAFGMFFQEFIDKCSKAYMEIELEIKIQYISCELFSKDIEKKKKLFDFVTEKTLNEISSMESDSKNIYINLSGSPENFNLTISNSRKINNEDYDCSMLLLIQGNRVEEDKPYLFYKKDRVIASLLNFK